MHTISRLQDVHRYDDTLHCYKATCDKINFMYLIIQCKDISCNKFSFLKEKRKYFDDEKRRIYGMYVCMYVCIYVC